MRTSGRCLCSGPDRCYPRLAAAISTPALATNSISTSISTSASRRKLMLLLPTFALPSRPAYASER